MKKPEYKKYLNDEGEIDEEMIRWDLEPDRRLLEGQIAEELEHRLEDEREIVNNDGSSTFLTKEELEVMRPILEEQIRDELEEQDEEALAEAVALKMEELQREKDYDDEEAED